MFVPRPDNPTVLLAHTHDTLWHSWRGHNKQPRPDEDNYHKYVEAEFQHDLGNLARVWLQARKIGQLGHYKSTHISSRVSSLFVLWKSSHTVRDRSALMSFFALVFLLYICVCVCVSVNGVLAAIHQLSTRKPHPKSKCQHYVKSSCIFMLFASLIFFRIVTDDFFSITVCFLQQISHLLVSASNFFNCIFLILLKFFHIPKALAINCMFGKLSVWNTE